MNAMQVLVLGLAVFGLIAVPLASCGLPFSIVNNQCKDDLGAVTLTLHKIQPAGVRPCAQSHLYSINVAVFPISELHQGCDPEIGAKDALDLLLQNKTRFLR